MMSADDPLAALLKPGRLIDVVDVGANPHDGSVPPYKELLAKRLCRVIGFEPQAEALRDLDKAKGPNETYLPYALGDGETHTLHVCVIDGMTSLFEPDPSALELFPKFPEWGRVVKRDRVRTVRLDDVSEIETIDWLKIDIQGGELSALQNGRSKLARVVAIQTEVSFVPLYRNQPPFGAILNCGRSVSCPMPSRISTGALLPPSGLRTLTTISTRWSKRISSMFETSGICRP